MRSETRIVQFLNGIFHVFEPQELDNAGAVLVRVGKTNVARFTHMIFQVLP